ncbi:MAG TPA: iron ABC transporter permease [Nitrososphaerales archaeon]|nr:iron ABC transporter permease [Nitrososphaerales archaeon]
MYKVKSLLILSGIVFAGLIIPIFFLILGISFFPEIGKPTITFLGLITSAGFGLIVGNTLEFAIGHAVLAVALAIVYAWIVARTDIPGKRIFELLPILELTMPLEVKAFAWTFLLDPRAGILNRMAKVLFGSGVPVFDIYSMSGLIFVAGMGGVGLAYIVILPAMKSIGPELEEASKVAGKGMLRTLYSITLRLLLPAIGSAFFLLVIGGLNNFDYPLIIGQPAGIQVLATDVYFYTSELLPPSYGSAGVVSIFYVAMALVGVSLYIWVTRRTYRFTTVTGKSSQLHPFKLRKWKPVALAVCVIILFLGFGLPFLSIILVSTTNIYLSASLSNIVVTFPKYFNLLGSVSGLYQSLNTTLIMGFGAAFGSTVVGLLLSFAALKSRARGGRVIEYITSIPLAFPGIVYSVALFWTLLLLPGVNIFYGTIYPMIIALAFIRLPYSSRIISGNLVQISNELEEASQVGGSGFTRTLTRISLPLIKDGILFSFVYTLIDSLRELGGVILLSTGGAVAFTVVLLNYYEATVLSAPVIAAGSVLLTTIIIVILAILFTIVHFWGRRPA